VCSGIFGQEYFEQYYDILVNCIKSIRYVEKYIRDTDNLATYEDEIITNVRFKQIAPDWSDVGNFLRMTTLKDDVFTEPPIESTSRHLMLLTYRLWILYSYQFELTVDDICAITMPRYLPDLSHVKGTLITRSCRIFLFSTTERTTISDHNES
jgi:hypothetical protein